MLLLAACSPDPPAEEPPPTSGQLDVLSYNVHGLPPSITGDDTEARMAQIGPLLGGFDLVGLQEVWQEEYHAILDEAVDYATRDRYTGKLEDRAYGMGLS